MGRKKSNDGWRSWESLGETRYLWVTVLYLTLDRNFSYETEHKRYLTQKTKLNTRNISGEIRKSDGIS